MIVDIDLFTSEATPSLASEDDTSKLTPMPSARKTQKAMKAVKAVKTMNSKDMGQFIWSTYMLFADPFYLHCRH
jgi:hypothetical protein